MYEKWQAHWTDILTTKKYKYGLIYPNVRKLPLYKKIKLSRAAYVSLARLAFNHGNFTQHLYKMHLVDSPLCTCDNESICDLNHIFFGCGNHIVEINRFLTKIVELSLILPTNISNIITVINENPPLCEIVLDFLYSVKIRL